MPRKKKGQRKTVQKLKKTIPGGTVERNGRTRQDNNDDSVRQEETNRSLRSSSRVVLGAQQSPNKMQPIARKRTSHPPPSAPKSVTTRATDDEESSVDEDEEEVRQDENDEVDLEDRPVWELFREFVAKTRTEEEKKRSSLLQAVKDYRAKTENPLRAEVYACVNTFVGSDTQKLKIILHELRVENIDDFVRKKLYFSPAENLKHSTLKVVKYIVESLEEKMILSFMCYLNLQVAINKRETISWSAFEMKESEDAPNKEFDTEPDDSPMELAEMDRIRHQIRKKLRRDLRLEYNNDSMFVNTSLVDKIIFATVMDSRKTRGSARGRQKLKISTIVLGFNPKLPFAFFHGKADLKDLKLNIIRLLPGGYQYLQNLKLVDSGFTSVYTAVCKISSSSIMSSSDFKRRTIEEQDVEEQLDIAELPAFQQNSKRRKVMKSLIEGKQHGGFKTLTLQYAQSRAPDFPITFKFKAVDGNMDGLVADLFERRIWSNPAPYIKARDSKTNFLKLEVNEDDGSVAYDEQSDEEECD